MVRRGFPGIVALVAALSALAPSRGDACMNAVYASDKTVAAVKEAEKILNDGDPVEARRRILALLEGASSFREETPSAKGVSDRARRILSLATVRIEDREGEYRKALLANAVTTLQWFVKTNPTDAAKQTDLGEALAKTKPADAKKILEDLATRDVLSTPYAYAALARLRAADGNEKGRDEALARCKQMAKVESICALVQPQPQSTAKK